MKKLIYSYLLIVVCLFLVSCKKYLDKIPSTLLSTPTTLKELSQILDNSLVMNTKVTPAFGEASADNYIALDYNSLPELDASIYRRQTISYNYGNDWQLSYAVVYNANLCLEYVEKIPVTPANESEWKYVKGAGLFYRAYSFLNLAWIYCKAYDPATANDDLGIDLRLKTDFNIPSKRSSVKETYERIISDAKESLAYLPGISSHVTRPWLAAGYGLLARTYLSMRQYDSAFRYSNLCLSIKSNLLDYNNIDKTLSIPFASIAYSNIETVFFSTMTTDRFAGPILRSERARVSPDLYASYSSDDLRKTAFFQSYSSGNYSFKGTYTTQVNTFFSGIATDEIYLIRAECNARKGDKDAALADLNTLMVKRWSNTVSYPTISASSPEEALDKILIERRKELLWRGIRWSDIKRLNKEGRNIILTRIIGSQTYTLQPNANYYALPLPQDIIQLTGIPQNPN